MSVSSITRYTAAASRGATMIDIVMGAALLLIVFVGVAGIAELSIDIITNSRARAGAIALANEWMEYVRSLEYQNIGTIGGIPGGPIPQSETVTLNGVTYTRRTTVQFVDDPYDGLGAADTFPTVSPVFVDYKSVRVAISWQSRGGTRTVYFVTRVEPLNGVEVQCTTSCGTLSILVVNAATQPVQNAEVHVVNPNVVPAIDLTTYTNTEGAVTLAGAPTSSGYEITVSKTGYNSAQTYGVTGQNPSPTPPHQQVLQNQTTTITFAPPSSGVDLLATKTIYTYSAIATSTWNEPFSGEGQIASSTNITVAGGTARLSGSGSYPTWGEFESVLIAPSMLHAWRTWSFEGNTPAQTAIVFRFLDENGVLIPDSKIPGNSFGISSNTVDLSDISTSTVPSIRIRASLTTTNTSTTPYVDSYSVLYDVGPAPLPLIPLHMRGLQKTIGAGPVYKYNNDFTTNASGSLTLADIEWDTYEITFPGATSYTIASACMPQPEYLAPGTSSTSRFYLAPRANHALGIEVSAGSVLAANATTTLTKTGYSATTTTDSCGQAFFNYLTSGVYTLTVSKAGYQTYTNTGVVISGVTRQSVSLQP